jgi:hypothetical protein
VRTAGSVCVRLPAVPERERDLLDTHWLVVVHSLGFVHFAVRVPVNPAPHAPVQVPSKAVGLAQPLNVP